mmetsp:Transcript_7230/g.20522  ORF Transcript_7230/g.20522 Transcript_7230/m.20522 type:complete len:233 (+) Transcript_7230:615-1313(+)
MSITPPNSKSAASKSAGTSGNTAKTADAKMAAHCRRVRKTSFVSPCGSKHKPSPPKYHGKYRARCARRGATTAQKSATSQMLRSSALASALARPIMPSVARPLAARTRCTASANSAPVLISLASHIRAKFSSSCNAARQRRGSASCSSVNRRLLDHNGIGGRLKGGPSSTGTGKSRSSGFSASTASSLPSSCASASSAASPTPAASAASPASTPASLENACSEGVASPLGAP